MKPKYVQYYVEGDDELKLINTLKKDLAVILPGKVHKLNVVERIIPDARLMTIPPQTIVVLVFDTDTNQVNILNRNIEKLNKCSYVSKVVTIPQINNLEDELICSCDIRQIKDLLGSKSNSEFKSDLIRVTNLANKLLAHHFDIKKFWNGTPKSPYQDIENLSHCVKLKK